MMNLQHSITIIACYFLFLYCYSFSLIDYVYSHMYSSVHYLFVGHPVCYLLFSFISVTRGTEVSVNTNVITLNIAISFHRDTFVFQRPAEQKLVNESDNAEKN
jgi:hypothetical protein